MFPAVRFVAAGAALALLNGLAPALAQGGAGGAGGMTGRMGGARMGPAAVDQLQRSIPSYDPAADYAQALAALKAQRFRAAAQLAQRVAEAAPANRDVWRLLGAAYAGDRDWRGSRRAYERAVRLGPNDANAHAGLGLALANLRDPQARTELAWLRDRASICGDTCPDAQHLLRFTETVEAALRMPDAPAG